MKALKYLIVAVVLTSAFVCPVKAASFTIDPSLDFLGAVAKTGGNSPSDDLAALEAFLGVTLTPPKDTLVANFENLNGTGPTINDMAGEYIVIHFGKGSGGSA